MYYKQVFLRANVMQNTANNPTIDLLDFINDPQDWQIHRCGVIDGLISQTEPVKMLYHYELLSDEQKQQNPLQGALLKQFDKILTRQEFADLLKIDVNQLKQPYQIKFYGKLIIFCQNPEIALRLYWTNTLKNFVIVDEKDVQTALKNAFTHWQFVDTVEFINKTANVTFVVHGADENEMIWQEQKNAQFEPLPSVIALDVQRELLQSAMVDDWFLQIYQSATDFLHDWQEKMLK